MYYRSVDMYHLVSQVLQPDLPNTEQQFGYAQYFKATRPYTQLDAAKART